MPGSAVPALAGFSEEVRMKMSAGAGKVLTMQDVAVCRYRCRAGQGKKCRAGDRGNEH